MDYRAWYKKNRNVMRNFNPKVVRALKPVHDAINERAELLAEISRHVENGQVGIIWSGMDCDCVSYSRASVVSADIRSLHRYIHDSYNDAEGPLSYYFVSVAQGRAHVYTSRDLALEAYEDGHSHVVYY